MPARSNVNVERICRGALVRAIAVADVRSRPLIMHEQSLSQHRSCPAVRWSSFPLRCRAVHGGGSAKACADAAAAVRATSCNACPTRRSAASNRRLSGGTFIQAAQIEDDLVRLKAPDRLHSHLFDRAWARSGAGDRPAGRAEGDPGLWLSSNPEKNRQQVESVVALGQTLSRT